MLDFTPIVPQLELILSGVLIIVVIALPKEWLLWVNNGITLSIACGLIVYLSNHNLTCALSVAIALLLLLQKSIKSELEHFEDDKQQASNPYAYWQNIAKYNTDMYQQYMNMMGMGMKMAMGMPVGTAATASTNHMQDLKKALQTTFNMYSDCDTSSCDCPTQRLEGYKDTKSQ